MSGGTRGFRWAFPYEPHYRRSSNCLACPETGVPSRGSDRPSSGAGSRACSPIAIASVTAPSMRLRERALSNFRFPAVPEAKVLPSSRRKPSSRRLPSLDHKMQTTMWVSDGGTICSWKCPVDALFGHRSLPDARWTRNSMRGLRASPSGPNHGFGSTIEIREERAVVVAQWVCARTRACELSTYPLRRWRFSLRCRWRVR